MIQVRLLYYHLFWLAISLNKSSTEAPKQCSHVSCEEDRTMFHHSTRALRRLPFFAQIDYKVATLAFCCFDNSLPPYLSSTLDIY